MQKRFARCRGGTMCRPFIRLLFAGVSAKRPYSSILLWILHYLLALAEDTEGAEKCKETLKFHG